MLELQVSFGAMKKEFGLVDIDLYLKLESVMWGLQTALPIYGVKSKLSSLIVKGDIEKTVDLMCETVDVGSHSRSEH